MRILFAALTVPFPPNNGQRMRNWSLLNALAKEGHSISVVALSGRAGLDADLAPLRAICQDVHLVPSPADARGRLKEAAGRLGALFSPLPYGVFKYQSENFLRVTRGLLAEDNFDAVLCDDVYLFNNLPREVRPRTLLNKHDFTFLIVRGFLSGVRNPLVSAYGWVELLKLRRWETRVSASVRGVLVSSEQDRRVLQSLAPGISMTIVPNVIDVYDYVPQESGDGNTLIFSGAMDYHANQDAVEFFAAQILPRIRTQFPQTQVIVAGRNPPESLRRRVERTPGITFTGTVADMRAEIAKAAVCVVPLRFGSGTRLKILEAAAMCKPVVSTNKGAEGLTFVPGKEILLADEPGEFAQKVATLLQDPALRDSMGRAARRRAEKEYSIEALRTALRGALSALAPCRADITPTRAPSR